jgi:cytochrome P450
MIELKLALAKIMKTFQISLTDERRAESVHTTTLGPKGGLFVNVKQY